VEIQDILAVCCGDACFVAAVVYDDPRGVDAIRARAAPKKGARRREWREFQAAR